MGVGFSQLPYQWKVWEIDRNAECVAYPGGCHIGKDFGQALPILWKIKVAMGINKHHSILIASALLG